MEDQSSAETPGETRAEEPKSSVKKSGRYIIAAVGIGILLVTGIAFFNKYRIENQKALDLLGTLEGGEVASLVEKVGKLVELPQDETPTVATVTDSEKLSGKPFFARAQNGDKVLIYQKSRRAILYRPSTNKIIETVTLSAPLPSDAPINTPAPSVSALSPSPTSTPSGTPTASPSPTSTL